MTKNEKLIWRLSEKPTAEGVARLVEQKVISPDEGRTILFSESDKKVALAQQEEIKFLRELVDKLANKQQNGWTTIYHTYERWKPAYGDWYVRYAPILTANSTTTPRITSTTHTGLGTGVVYANSVNAGSSTNLASSSTKPLSSLN